MYKISQFTKEQYKPKDVANYLGVTSRTISSYCKDGILDEVIAESGRRTIPKESLIVYLDKKGLIDYTDYARFDVVYCRVSMNKQSNSDDLQCQIDSVLAYAAFHNPKDLIILKEIGSGLSEDRKQLLKLLKLIMENKVDRVFITYKDRLTRFGFDYIETLCNFHKTSIIVISSEVQDKSVQEELAEDLCSIVHSFSNELCELRGKVLKVVNKELGGDKNDISGTETDKNSK